MNDSQLTDLVQIQQFLAASQSIEFRPVSKQERYEFIKETLDRLKYRSSSKKDKGIVVRYLMKMTSYSRQQLTRLIKQHRTTGIVARRKVLQVKSGFKRQYSAMDIMLLVKTDEAHSTLSGPATKKLFERAYRIFNQNEYANLSSISVSHLYNLRKSDFYTRQRRTFDKTKPVKNAIGERRKPMPCGNPGYLRVDTVHQGDLDKEKGVYHINAVDDVTQFEVVIAAERISERYLVPVLEILLNTFPFTILGFHSDNVLNLESTIILNKKLPMAE